MIIALDYDGTFTQDPELWLKLIPLFRAAGHEVFCCTMRTPAEVSGMDSKLLSVVQVIPTSRAGKAEFLKKMGIIVDVWIDDSPMFILADAADRPAKRPAASQGLPNGTGKVTARLSLNKSLKEGSHA